MSTNPGWKTLKKIARVPLQFRLIPAALTLLISDGALLRGQESTKEAFQFSEPVTTDEKRTSIGSWGHLEFYPLILEPSDYFISRSPDLHSQRNETVWKFNSLNSDGVRGILNNSGINPKLCDLLLSEQYMTYNSDSGLYEIRPPEHAIVALNAENRSLLYPQILPHNLQNPYHSTYALPTGGVKMISNLSSGVPRNQLDLIAHLSYKKGNTVNFSDINLVLARAKDEKERWRIVKTITRERSLSVKLRITQSSNLLQLANYWNAGGKNREILPILESIMNTPGIETLDIIHLLPPTPRKLLHTYPTTEGYGLANELPDCFWTSASFFSEDPPDRYLDSIDQVIKNRYEKAVRPLQLGDMIMLSDKQTGKGIHGCNYLAGNLVYTKNGKSLGRPWIISTIENVINEYLKVKEMSVSFLRLKPQYQQ